MGYTIDKDVPVPETRGTATKYPFAEMEVGDSFFATHPTTHKIRSAANHWGRKQDPPVKFAVRLANPGVRCWRVG